MMRKVNIPIISLSSSPLPEEPEASLLPSPLGQHHDPAAAVMIPTGITYWAVRNMEVVARTLQLTRRAPSKLSRREVKNTLLLELKYMPDQRYHSV